MQLLANPRLIFINSLAESDTASLMAAATDPSPVPEASTLSIGSYETALCIVPPRQLWAPVDRLRALYDKAYEKWPPHVNLVYPFVRPES